MLAVPYKKSARIVGDVMGKYHPHGDSRDLRHRSCALAQDFSMRYTLVDGQGNFGSLDGDSAGGHALHRDPAHPPGRGDVASEDIDKETVDWVPNYDESELRAHRCLPARVPNLLVSGSSGIAVGMATNIPPHNLGEVIDAVILLIEDQAGSRTFAELLGVLPGPDFPTAGLHLRRRRHPVEAYLSLAAANHPGARPRPRSTSSPKDRQRIVVTEIPYQVNKARLVERIASAGASEKRVEGISDHARRVRPQGHPGRHGAQAR